MGTLQKSKLDISTQLPISFYFRKAPKENKRLIIFLHGYTDSASSFLTRVDEGANLEFDILAPNGPFPVPVPTDTGFKEAYAWYFEDHSLNKVLIPKEVTIDILKNLLAELNLENHQKIIVGFSQGGFLAPKLAEQISHVEKIIGIGCDYRKDSYQKIKHVRIYGIHGIDDSVVDYQKASENFSKLISDGFVGKFASIQDMGHIINTEVKSILREFILD